MIRLVSQFDRPRMRASVAAPKSSGSCSCCCCCIATTVGAGVLTARAVGHVSPDQRYTDLAQGWRWKVLASLLLPLSIAISVALHTLGRVAGDSTAATLLIWCAPFMGLGAYVGGLLLIRHNAGLQKRYFALLLLGIPVCVVIEGVLWIAALSILK